MYAHITDISTQAGSCNTQSSSGEQSTGSSRITVHCTLLRSLFSKSLSELSLELLADGAESAKMVSAASGMHTYFAKHLQSVIHQAYVLRVQLDHQKHIIAVNRGPIDELERLEADMRKLTAHLESLKLDIDKTVALVLHRRLQFGGEEENLAELRDELARCASDVASKECQIKKLRSEKSRCELNISLARDCIKKLEYDFSALADPFRNCFVPGN